MNIPKWWALLGLMILLPLGCGSEQAADAETDPAPVASAPAAVDANMIADRSWLVVPSVLDWMLQSRDPQAVARVTQAFLRMGKFDRVARERAYAGPLAREAWIRRG